MKALLSDIKACTTCSEYLVDGVNPVLTADTKSKIAIIGQAPGRQVHRTGIPWDDKSGIRLREWMNISKSTFYDPEMIALVPMGFCYPGKGKTGDLPPRPECAPQWHPKLFNSFKSLQLILLIGSYAQKYYLGESRKKTLTETVFNYQDYLPTYLVLPNPSPRNNIWLKKNQWFEKLILPELRARTIEVLK